MCGLLLEERDVWVIIRGQRCIGCYWEFLIQAMLHSLYTC